MEKYVLIDPPYNNYAVSETGVVKNVKTNKILSQNIRHDGYLQVSLWNKGKGLSLKIHRLVALAHIPNPKGLPYVNHKDGNKLNNDVSNLEWVTPLNNNLHAVANDLVNRVKVKVIDTLDNKTYVFESITQAAKYFGYDPRVISRASKRKNNTYKHLLIIRI